MTTTTAKQRLIRTVQLGTATVEGIVLSTIVLHATVTLGLPPASVGVILALGAGTAIALAVPLGMLTDRLGLGRAAAALSALASLALAGYAVTDTGAGFTAAAIAFAVAQSASGAARQALAVEGADPADRLAIRATMHMLLNAGIGIGTTIGALLAAVDLGTTTETAYGVGAVSMALAALLLVALTGRRRPGAGTSAPATGGMLLALRDRRFATALGLAAAIQLTMPVLSVILPVWVVLRSGGPAWLPAVALALNTVAVIAGQRRWAARVTSTRSTVRTGVAAAIALAAAGALLAVSARTDSPIAFSVVVVAGVLALTVGEIGGGLATWRVALSEVPAAAEGRYQAAYSMSTSAARIVGPSLALPLVLTLGPVGWLVLGATMASGCLGIAALASETPLGSLRGPGRAAVRRARARADRARAAEAC
ncbi:MFS transporter [Nocardioides sp. SLBN-35]|uniref:MFS transporter n=1 Tax=Nocardioides sp. SLBN-35 TaxID=2768445 RepID=UPI001154A45D|nr:MFS transporter [Nocardioides sp. SLBN-35]TQK71821.1 MFS transporter [Nocardioides sp. SLBN-35]